MRGKVARVYFEKGTDGTFNRPALMQAETHLDCEVRDSLLELRVFAVSKYRLQLVYLCENLDKREKCHISLHSVLFTYDSVVFFKVFCNPELPDHQKGVSDILVCAPSILINLRVSDLGHLVHKKHYVCL